MAPISIIEEETLAKPNGVMPKHIPSVSVYAIFFRLGII
jgi:hypothetical protein